MKLLFALPLLYCVLTFAAQADYQCPMDIGEPEPLYALMAHIDPMVWEIPDSPSKRNPALSELRADLENLKKKYEAFHDSVYEQDLKVSEEERKKLAEEVLSLMGVFAQKAAQKIDENKDETIESKDDKIKTGFSNLLKQLARTVLSQSETLRTSEKITRELLKLPTAAKAIVKSFTDQFEFNRKKMHKSICEFLEKEAEVCSIGEEKTDRSSMDRRQKAAENIHSSLSLLHESLDRNLRQASLQLERKLGAWKPGDKMKRGWAKLTGKQEPKIDWTKVDFANDVAPLLKLCGVQRALENVDPSRGKKFSALLLPPASYKEDCKRFFCEGPRLLSSPDSPAHKDSCKFVLRFPAMQADYVRGFDEWKSKQTAQPGYNLAAICPLDGVPRRDQNRSVHQTQENQPRPR